MNLYVIKVKTKESEKYLLGGNKLDMHKKTQIAIRRTYQYYSKIKGD